MTNELFDKEQNRREFLRNIGRYLILGGLITTTGVLVAKRISRAEDCEYPDELAVTKGICRACVSLNNCDLPLALSARQEMVG